MRSKLQQAATAFRDELGDGDTEGTNRSPSPYAGDLHEGWRGAAKVNASDNPKE